MSMPAAIESGNFREDLDFRMLAAYCGAGRTRAARRAAAVGGTFFAKAVRGRMDARAFQLAMVSEMAFRLRWPGNVGNYRNARERVNRFYARGNVERNTLAEIFELERRVALGGAGGCGQWRSGEGEVIDANLEAMPLQALAKLRTCVGDSAGRLCWRSGRRWM